MAIWMAVLDAVGKANQQAAQLRIKKANEEVAKANAKMQGNLYGMQLEAKFNKSMASDAVMAAAQNRRGGSVSAIASAAESQFNWDLDFADLSTKIQDEGYDFNINSLSGAGDNALNQGYMSAAISGYNEYQKQSSLQDVNKKYSLLAIKDK